MAACTVKNSTIPAELAKKSNCETECTASGFCELLNAYVELWQAYLLYEIHQVKFDNGAIAFDKYAIVQ
eukprot:Awhi_evm1s4156